MYPIRRLKMRLKHVRAMLQLCIFVRRLARGVWEVYPISCPCQNNTERLDVLRLSICLSKYRRFSTMAAAQP